jgi:hypothetical protein
MICEADAYFETWLGFYWMVEDPENNDPYDKDGIPPLGWDSDDDGIV